MDDNIFDDEDEAVVAASSSNKVEEEQTDLWGEGEEGGGDLVDSDEEQATKAKTKAKKPAKKRSPQQEEVEDDDEDDDDEEKDEDDDDDDDDDDSGNNRRKRPLPGKDKKAKKAAKRAKRAKRTARSFFLDEAEDADGSDEEDGEWERGADAAELNEEEKAANALVEARHRKNREMLETDEHELAARYERQHKQEKARAAVMKQFADQRGGSGVGSSIVDQTALAPTKDDLPIFRIKCVPGLELQLIRSIYLKLADATSRGEARSTVKAAFCTAAQGYIYVESGSEVHARQAVTGLRGLYVRSFTKVPTGEMSEVVTVSKTRKPLEVGQWCRLRRGPLKGDLCKIIEVVEGGLKAFIMAVPRPDFSQSKKLAPGVKPPRPPQRLFDAQEAQRAKQDQDVGTEVQRKKHIAGPPDTYDFWCNEYYRGGFLYKLVSAESYLNPHEVKPRLEELQLFRPRKAQREYDDDDEDDQQENDDDEAHGEALLQDLTAQMKTIEDQQASVVVPFVLGDLVQVSSGDLLHLICKIIRIEDGQGADGKKIVCEPYNRDTLQRDSFEIESKFLVKYITPGLHVKVVAGRFSGTTGRVVSVTTLDGDQVATILSDGTNTEMRVNVGMVQISNEISVGHGDLCGYELYDLVSLSVNETAMIVQVGAERLRLLTHMDIVKDVLPQEVQRKRNQQSNRSSGFDAQQATVNIGDLVEVRTGPYIKKKGTVKAILNGCFWIHSTSLLKNSGVFVIRGRQCVLSGRSKASIQVSSSISGNSLVSTKVTGGGGFRAPPDAAVGKTVKIIKGGFKGFLAQVVEATQSTYTVELLARVKKIVIEKTKCKICGDKEGSTFGEGGVPRAVGVAFTSTPAGGETPYGGGSTPFHGDGAATPLHSSQTDLAPNPFRASEEDEDDDSQTDPEPMGPPGFDTQRSASYMRSESQLRSVHSPSMNSNASPYPVSKEERDQNIYKYWPAGMFVVCNPSVHQSYSGMLAVIEQPVDSQGKLSVSLVAGQAERRTFYTHHTDVEPAAIEKDHRVYLIFDEKGYEGRHGHAIKKIAKDWVVRISPDHSKPLESQKTILIKKSSQLVRVEGKTFQEEWGEHQ